MTTGIYKRTKGQLIKMKNSMKGKNTSKHSDARKKNNSEAHMGMQSNWQGGIDEATSRKRALKRDSHTCQRCGINDKEFLCVDHIVPKSVRPDIRADINNMVTLCANCHMKKTKNEYRNGTYKSSNL